MAEPFIAVHRGKGVEHASIRTPKRVEGKKVNNPIYLSISAESLTWTRADSAAKKKASSSIPLKKGALIRQ
ncbi:MAG: hypothetical protein LBR53_02990 [Deltaproteobacteria bacterium]|jgi:hypothetical protein|nr:hypothetical protein [Deltaproteobacteria bacterium]